MQASCLRTGAGLSTAERLGEEAPGHLHRAHAVGMGVWAELDPAREVMSSPLLGMCKERLGDWLSEGHRCGQMVRLAIQTFEGSI